MIKYEIEGGVLILRVATGGYPLLRDALLAARRDPTSRPKMPLLVDMRGEPLNVHYEDVRWRMEILNEMREQFGPRWAFVTGPGPVRAGVGRMFAVFSQSEGLEVGAFADKAAALHWLGEADVVPLGCITRIRDGSITTFRAHGAAAPEVLIAALREFLAEPTPHVLWDLRECGVAYHAHGRLPSLVSQLIRADHSKRPSGRSAFVCSCDVDFNVMRNFIAYAEANEYGIELAAFLDLGAARRWLGDESASER